MVTGCEKGASFHYHGTYASKTAGMLHLSKCDTSWTETSSNKGEYKKTLVTAKILWQFKDLTVIFSFFSVHMPEKEDMLP